MRQPPEADLRCRLALQVMIHCPQGAPKVAEGTAPGASGIGGGKSDRRPAGDRLPTHRRKHGRLIARRPAGERRPGLTEWLTGCRRVPCCEEASQAHGHRDLALLSSPGQRLGVTSSGRCPDAPRGRPQGKVDASDQPVERPHRASAGWGCRVVDRMMMLTVGAAARRRMVIRGWVVTDFAYGQDLVRALMREQHSGARASMFASPCGTRPG